MGSPLIGVTGRRRTAGQVSGFPDTLAHLELDLFLADFHRDVLEAGGLPVPIPLDGDPTAYLDRLDGLVLTGGADIEPHHYGAEPDGAGLYEPERDEVELALAHAALGSSVPVLGVCRGMQVLNVAAGGSLHQHVPPHSRYEGDPADAVHDVAFEPGSRLAALYGATTEVNSLHHQTVDRLADGFAVTGWADDGTVEAMERPGSDVLAVQWHPEFRPTCEPVFGWLIERARP